MLFNWWRRWPKRSTYLAMPLRAQLGQRQGSKRLTPRPWRPSLELLEDRITPSSYTVMNTSGVSSVLNSLPWAVQQADADRLGAPVTINFNIPTSDSGYNVTTGAYTIALAGTLTLDNTNPGESIIIEGPTTAGLTIQGGAFTSLFSVFAVTQGTTATIENLSITNGIPNDPPGYAKGGGISNDGTLTVNNATLCHNYGYYGAGIYNDQGGILTVNNSTVSNNGFAVGGGGGIYNRGSLVVSNSTLSGNSATAGGGIFNNGGLAVSNSTFFANLANFGGGIYTYFGTATVSNSTLTGNVAYDNGAGADGGGIENQSGGLTIGDTIVAGNTAPADPDISGSITTDNGYDLLGTAVGSTTNNPNDVFSDNPLLSPLDNYGGPTQTIALLPRSPAIGKGEAIPGITTDQRGLPRPPANPDIGAFQTQNSGGRGIVVTSASESDSSGQTTLQDALKLAEVQAFSSTVATITIPANLGTITLTAPISVGPVNNLPIALTINGGIVSGNSSNQLFMIASGSKVILNSMTLYGGDPPNGSVDNSGLLTLTNCTLADDNASDGGAIYNTGTLIVTNCTFTNDSASSSGGAIYNAGGAVTLIDSTFSANSAPSGGAITNDSGTVTITNCTISGNTASAGPGGGIENNGGLVLQNTIEAGNTSSSGGPDVDNSGGTISANYSMIGDITNSDISNATGTSNILDPTNLGLGSLGNYGGPTQTIALLPNSPAIDAGSNNLAVDVNDNPLSTDQRGQPRVVNGTVDIGAFESQGFTLAIAAGNNQVVPLQTAFNPLDVTVTANNPAEPVIGGMVSFTVVPGINGAGATLSSATATATIGNAQTSVVPTGNSIIGSYSITASASGSAPISFHLSNGTAIYWVLHTNDSGPGSLRQALLDADANNTGTAANPDLIEFNIPATDPTIAPLTPLPAITDTLTIDGYTQPGASRNTLTVGDNAVLKVVLDSTNSGGLVISAANSTVEGLELENFGIGIHVAPGATGDTVAGNFINGNNSANTGLWIETSSNTVGGADPAARNVIFGAVVADVRIGFGASPAEHNVIEGNYIGTTIDGSAFAGGNDSQGVWLVNANCNTIGGSTGAARNVIGSPFALVNQEASGNVVEGNYIGTNAAGTIGLDDGAFIQDEGNGTLILDNLVTGLSLGGEGSRAQGNLIGTDYTGTMPLLPENDGFGAGGSVGLGGSGNLLGGTAAGAGNIIAFGAGVGVSGTGDRIEGNSIYGNAGLGIDLLNSGRVVSEDITTNAGNDLANHVGANDLMNFPTLTSAYTLNGTTTIGGSLSTGAANGHVFLPNATINLDFYANKLPDPTGYGQGQDWLGNYPVTTDTNGNVSFTATGLQPIPAGFGYITATATDAAGDTSEFCADFQPAPTSGGPYTIYAGDSLDLLAATAGPGPWTYSWTVNGYTTISVNGQGQPIPSEPIAGQQPTLTWPQLQSLGIDVSSSPFTVYAEANNVMLPPASLTVEATPPTASITTSLPTDSSGNPTTPASVPIILAANVTDPSQADTAAGYSWTVVQHTPTGSLTPVLNGGEYATRVLGASSAPSNADNGAFDGAATDALGQPEGNTWSPDQAAGTPYLTLGFDTPVYADGLTIWENAGFSRFDFGHDIFDANGFVTQVDLLDSQGQYHTVWSGSDPTSSVAEAPFQVPWSQIPDLVNGRTPYLVTGARIYTTNSTPDNADQVVYNNPAIDAVQLSGVYDPTASGSLPLSGSYDPAVNRGRSEQYATTVLSLTPDFSAVLPPTSSAYNSGSSGAQWSVGQAFGEPNVTNYDDDSNAWSAANENSDPSATPPIPADQTLAVGFAIPVYADGVTIRETQGNGFVTAVDVLPVGADPNSGWQTVWSGTDPTLPGTPADFTAYWPETAYLVTAVRIHVNTDHDLNSYENIDSVQLHGWFDRGTPIASGTTRNLSFTPNADGTYVATLTATDTQGGVAMTQATIDVANTVPPTAHISNPTYSAGQVGLTLSASDPAPGDQAASFTIDWGDGTHGTFVPAISGSATVSHTYSAPGAFPVTVTASDTNQKTSPTASALILFSASSADNIAVSGGPSAGQVAVTSAAATDTPTLFYSPTDLVFLIGEDSADSYTINFGHTLTTPVAIAAAGGNLAANGAAGDNFFDKVPGRNGAPSQLSWAPVYAQAAPVETIAYTGVQTQVLVGGSGNNYYLDPGSGTTLDGGPGANTMVITSTSGTGVVIDGGPSTNNYVIDLGSLAGPVTINDSQATASNNLAINAAPGDNAITMSGSQVTAGSQTIDVDASLTSASINGGSGSNRLIVANVTVPIQNLVIVANGTSTSVTLSNVGPSVAELSVTGTSGATQVQGTLPVNGTVTNPGQIILAPAPTAPPPSTATYTQTTTGSLSEQIGGLTPQTLYGQIIVTGTVNLAGTLRVALINGFTPHLNDQFKMIDNQGTNPVTGTFTGLPEGATIWDSTHTYDFAISYVGGDGNDVVLTVVSVFSPASLSGTVFADFNDDGQIDFGEKGIAGVAIALTGTDDLGHAVNLKQLTDAAGAYVFLNLRPGNYDITETQPAGYLQGIDSIGTTGGSLVATDQFFVQLAQGLNGLNYNFGEQPAATGPVQRGQTAGIGFWNNKNGQALIKGLNGGAGSELANWLAATLPNMFGVNAGSNNLTGKTNADVAALFQQDFLLKGVKLDAQVLATALSVYATNATLDATQVAGRYGFTVAGDGVGTASVNIGSNGDAFGVANNSTLTVLDLLRATDAQAVNGALYNNNGAKRNEANNVYSAVNQAGNIS